MRLYLVQHGEALSKELDSQRPLSDGGRTDVSRLARFLQAAGIQAASVINSGKLRARQTADLLASAVASRRSAQVLSGLGPNDSPEEFAKQVAQWKQDTLVIGHLPFLSKLVAYLVVGSRDEVVSFRPGTAVCLEHSEPSKWTIAWMIRPELLRE